MTTSPAPSQTPSTLKPGTVEVWRVALDPAPERVELCRQILSVDESAAAARFKRDIDQHRFVVRRAVRRWVLASHLGVKPLAIDFALAKFGKPSIATPAGSNLQFSASSSADLALIGVAVGSTIGIDVEAQRPLGDDLDRIIRLLASEEQVALLEMAPEKRLGAFYDYWTSKEAVLKASGLGLSSGLDQFAVSVDPGRKPTLLHWKHETPQNLQWELIPLESKPDFSATLATHPGSVVVVRDWNWDLPGFSTGDPPKRPRLEDPKRCPEQSLGHPTEYLSKDLPP